jgi:hypothetical protein
MRVMLQNKQKPYYCTEHPHVNAEVTSIESELPYSGRSAGNLLEVRASAKEETSFRAKKAMGVWCRQKSAEAVVLRDRSLWKDKSTHARRKGRMLGLVKVSGSLW